MAYIGVVCFADEMKKLALGKETKLDPAMVLYFGLDHHPAIQKK